MQHIPLFKDLVQSYLKNSILFQYSLRMQTYFCFYLSTKMRRETSFKKTPVIFIILVFLSFYH